MSINVRFVCTRESATEIYTAVWRSILGGAFQ